MRVSSKVLPVVLVTLVAAASLAAWAGPAAINADAEGVAIHGHDPVAYFTDGKPVPGSASITAQHGGVTYRFASTANRDAFVKEPDRYVPQFGGFCAYGVSVGGKFDIDPTAWRIVEGKLYLNKNPDVQKLWVKDVPGNIMKARESWPKIKDVPAKDL